MNPVNSSPSLLSLSPLLHDASPYYDDMEYYGDDDEEEDYNDEEFTPRCLLPAPLKTWTAEPGVKLVTLALVVIGSRILIPPPLPPWSPFLVIVQTDICPLILFVAVVLFLRLPFPAFLVQPVRKHILNIERSDISTSLLLPSPFNHPACHLSPVL